MPRRKLNRKRHFGTVHGETGAVYAQDGLLFDTDGLECDIDGRPVDVDDDEPSEPVRPDLSPEEHDGDMPDVRGALLGKNDLALWGRGAKDFIWAHIKDAILAHYNRAVDNRRDAVDLLIDEGLVRPDQAREVDE
jgi:hypothetical protein